MTAYLPMHQQNMAPIVFSALLLLQATLAFGQDTLCGTEGQFCANKFPFQVNASKCGNYSDIFSEPNVTMNQDSPLGNYTYTNISEVMDDTMYLSEVLLGKAYELYQEEQALVDSAQSCESSSVKTEFTSMRLNKSQCTIDVDDVINVITPVLQEKWLLIHYGKSADHPAKSCKDLFEHDTLLPSGIYWIQGTGGTPVQLYCDMEGANCDGTGGWLRLYKLDLQQDDEEFHECPSGQFEQYAGLGTDNVLCRRKGNVLGCRAAMFSVNDQSYSQVCGKATGYQKGNTDAFYRVSGHALEKTVEDNYVDGISVTHGSPRTHIFTFASGCSESGACWVPSRCPCETDGNPGVPKFIGHDDFYCESASYWHPSWGVWYNEPLWDAKECLWKETPCCSVTSNIPWFLKELSHSTSNSVEVRVCTDEYTNGEDVGFSQLELYVK